MTTKNSLEKYDFVTDGYSAELEARVGELLDEIERLKTSHEKFKKLAKELINAEREAKNEARREVCELTALVECPTHPSTSREQGVAKERGWDCFGKGE